MIPTRYSDEARETPQGVGAIAGPSGGGYPPTGEQARRLRARFKFFEVRNFREERK